MVLVVLGGFAVAMLSGAASAAPDFSGRWSVSGAIRAHGPIGPVVASANPVCLFQQGAGGISGSCTGPNATGPANGSFKGQNVLWRWIFHARTGPSGTATFNGTLGTDGVIRGALTMTTQPGKVGDFTQSRR